MDAKPTPMWLKRFPIVDQEHVPDLEQRAAIHEFGGKIPRHAAEEKAYQDYRHDQLVEAGAHHLVGMKAAHAAGATDQATKHGAMYVLALRALGHDNTISPPDEVATKAANTPSDVYHFKAHKGDAYSIRAHDGTDKPMQKSLGENIAALLRSRILSKGDDVVGKPMTSLASAATARPVESRRCGQNGRGANGKKNPYFDYSDYVPDSMKASNRPSGITVHQKGREVIASLNHGYGDIRAFRRGDGGYAITYDGLKRGHPILQQYRQHVVRALGDHVKAAHGAPYFVTGDEPSLQGRAN